jgi:hypothetical protein
MPRKAQTLEQWLEKCHGSPYEAQRRLRAMAHSLRAMGKSGERYEQMADELKKQAPPLEPIVGKCSVCHPGERKAFLCPEHGKAQRVYVDGPPRKRRKRRAKCNAGVIQTGPRLTLPAPTERPFNIGRCLRNGRFGPDVTNGNASACALQAGSADWGNPATVHTHFPQYRTNHCGIRRSLGKGRSLSPPFGCVGLLVERPTFLLTLVVGRWGQ